MLILLASAQAIAPAPGDSERVVINIIAPAPCSDKDDIGFDEEIVVCAKREQASTHRISGAEGSVDQLVPRAEVRLADGTTVAAETESTDLGMARSQRLMVRLKVKF